MSSQPQSLARTREELHDLATEILSLTNTFTPTPPETLGPEDPLIRKAKALISLAQAPANYLFSSTITCLEMISIRTLSDFDTFSHIPPPPSTISLTNLSQKCHTDPNLLNRLLRILTSSNFITQNDQGEYSHTALSLGFSHADNIAPRLLDLVYETGVLKLARLPEFLAYRKDDNKTLFIEPSADVEDSTRYNLFTWCEGYTKGEKTTFEIMEEQPEKMKRFQKGMSVSKDVNPYVGFYDFSKLLVGREEEGEEEGEDSRRPVFVDVGGGHGDAIKAILSTYPEFSAERCILQDSAPVVQFAEQEAGLPRGVKFQAHDFFEPQPVRGARAYYFRAIAHDLSDASLRRVLGRIRDAMDSGSRVLIADEILPEVGSEGMIAVKDMFMMVIGGKERTEREFRHVIEEVGLEVEGVYRVAGKGGYGIVEARLK